MSDKLREALEAVLSAGRGPSGRIILERYQEDKLREALAADDAARGTMREAWDAVIAEARGIDAIDLLDKVAAYGEACWQAATRAAAPKTSELETFLSLAKAAGITHIGQLEPGLTEALRKTEIAAPQSAGPVAYRVRLAAPENGMKHIYAEHPKMLAYMPAEQEPLYLHPAPTDAQWAKQAYEMADALRAHLSTRPQRDEWQPIETAPRDGTHVLCVWACAWGEMVYEGWCQSAGTARDGGDFWRSHSLVPVSGRPTHWMPLPAPPTKKEQP